MKRDLHELAARDYDVVVVGGGIYGATLARESALAGFATALVEANDFCSGTSANSLKIIHGGLRYLQQLDVGRMRESVFERRAFLRTAPHLVRPLACLMPTLRGQCLKSLPAMAAGMLINDLVSFDRNAGVDPARRLPGGRAVSREACLRLLPGQDPAEVTGGAVWHDAIACDTERVVIGLIESAVRAGAKAANYAPVVEALGTPDAVRGVRVRDAETGATHEVAARVVVNAAGPWAEEVLELLGGRARLPGSRWALAMNLLLAQPWPGEHAAGLVSRGAADRRERLLFFVPWRGHTLVGTYYRLHDGRPADRLVTDADVDAFIADIRRAYPPIRATPSDVRLVYAGCLPVARVPTHGGEPGLCRRTRIVDHAKTDGVSGLVSVVGVKYTTARRAAEDALAIVSAKLERRPEPSRTADAALPGGDIADFDEFSRTVAHERASFGADIREHLLSAYGSHIPALLAAADGNPALLDRLAGGVPVIGGEVTYAVRSEMARTVADVVWRRTGLGATGLPAVDAVRACARLMASERGWSPGRIEQELADVAARGYPRPLPSA